MDILMHAKTRNTMIMLLMLGLAFNLAMVLVFSFQAG
jgi:hypothetical protein